MFFATTRSRRHRGSQVQEHHLADEFLHPGRVLLTEEVILGVCMLGTGLLYLFSQMPGQVLETAAKGRALVRHSVAGLAPAVLPQEASGDGVDIAAAAQPMLSALRQATTLESHGDFSLSAQKAWRKVYAAGQELGFTPLRASGGGLSLWLLDIERERAQILEDQLNALLPGQREALQAARRVLLSVEQREALAADPAHRDAEQQRLAAVAEAQLHVTWPMVVAAAPEALREEAVGLCGLMLEARANAAAISRLDQTLNYGYWMAVSRAAATEAGMAARAAMQRAERAAESGAWEEARSHYDEAFTAWGRVFEADPEVAENSELGRELREHADRYREISSLNLMPAAARGVMEQIADGSQT
jgi:hypothetical protein